MTNTETVAARIAAHQEQRKQFYDEMEECLVDVAKWGQERLKKLRKHQCELLEQAPKELSDEDFSALVYYIINDSNADSLCEIVPLDWNMMVAWSEGKKLEMVDPCMRYGILQLLRFAIIQIDLESLEDAIVSAAKGTDNRLEAKAVTKEVERDEFADLFEYTLGEGLSLGTKLVDIPAYEESNMVAVRNGLIHVQIATVADVLRYRKEEFDRQPRMTVNPAHLSARLKLIEGVNEKSAIKLVNWLIEAAKLKGPDVEDLPEV